MDGLHIENVSMRFDLPNGTHVQALKDVSIELKTGEIMSVLGPSGCGKTTLLNIVAGFLAPTGGQVRMNGHVVTGPNAERGMVFQQGALFEWMSVRENVGFGPSMKGTPRAEKAEIVDHLLDVVGLQDFKEKAVYELSGGMQQRVALARCLANDPDVIRVGASYLQVDAFLFPIYMMLFSINSLLQALKRPIWTLWISIYRQGFGIAFFIWVFVGLWGFDVWGVWFGIAAAVSSGWVIALIVVIAVAYKHIGGVFGKAAGTPA